MEAAQVSSHDLRSESCHVIRGGHTVYVGSSGIRSACTSSTQGWCITSHGLWVKRLKAHATGYSIHSEGVKVIDEELVDIQRKRKEAIHIRQQRPSSNREWCYDLSPHKKPPLIMWQRSCTEIVTPRSSMNLPWKSNATGHDLILEVVSPFIKRLLQLTTRELNASPAFDLTS